MPRNLQANDLPPLLAGWVPCQVPSDESIKIIVECDGFQYHKEKAAFVHDRKRDRVLNASGYEVLRYSGTEIYTDPIAAGADLAEYLWSKE